MKCKLLPRATLLAPSIERDAGREKEMDGEETARGQNGRVCEIRMSL